MKVAQVSIQTNVGTSYEWQFQGEEQECLDAAQDRFNYCRRVNPVLTEETFHLFNDRGEFVNLFELTHTPESVYHRHTKVDKHAWQVDKISKEEFMAVYRNAGPMHVSSETVRMGSAWFKDVKVWVSRKVRYTWMYSI